MSSTKVPQTDLRVIFIIFLTCIIGTMEDGMTQIQSQRDHVRSIGVCNYNHENRHLSCHYVYLHNKITIGTGYTGIERLTIYCGSNILKSSLGEGAFEHLKTLQHLSIEQCRLHELDGKVFREIKSLISLTVSHAFMGELYLDFSIWPNLRDVNIVYSGIRKIVSSHLCGSRIQNINFTSNGLYQTEGLGFLTSGNTPCLQNLVSLDLSYNFFKKFELPLGKLFPNLKGFFLKFSDVEYFYPSVFQNLTEIAEIDLMGNHLTSIGPEIFHIHTQLQRLSLQHNNISYIHPGFLQHFPALTSLNLRENQIERLGHVFKNSSHIRHLSYLAIASNPLRDIEVVLNQTFSKLKHLSISETAIAILHGEWFKGVKRLKSFFCQVNYLTRIESGTFQYLTELTELGLGRNKINFIARDAFSHLPHLKVLLLEQNSLKEVPEAILNTMSLPSVTLNGNYITAVGMDVLSRFGNHIMRMDIKRDGWIPHYNRPETFNQFAVFPHPYEVHGRQSVKKETSVEKNLWSDRLSLLKLALNHDNVSSASIHIHTLNRITQIYFQVDGRTENPLQPIPVLDLTYNIIYLIGDPELNVLQALSEGLSCYYDFGEVSHSPDGQPMQKGQFALKLKSHVDDNLNGHCSIKHYRNTVIETTVSRLKPLLLNDLKDWSPNSHQEDAWQNRDQTLRNTSLCIFDELCQPKMCGCCNMALCHCTGKCPNNCICLTSETREFTIIDCGGRGLSQVPIREHISPTHLALDGNNLGRLQSDAFSKYPDLTHLYLNNSLISNITKGAFRGLSKLRVLNLRDNFLEEISERTFEGLIELRVLDLGSNSISAIPQNAFGLMRLEELYLHNNSLVSLKGQYRTLAALSAMSLGRNPWDCQCTVGVPFKKWLIKNSHKISDVLDIYCLLEDSSDTNSSGSFISSLYLSHWNQSEELRNTTAVRLLEMDFASCQSDILMIIISAAEGLLLLLFITMSVILIRKWGPIKMCILVKILSPCRKPVSLEGKEYDVNVIYCEMDSDIIGFNLVPNLEAANMRVCVDYKSWPLGQYKLGTINAAIEKSRFTLFLLSEYFFNDPFCVFALEVALTKALTKERKHVIFVTRSVGLPERATAEVKLYVKLCPDSMVCLKDKLLWTKLKAMMPSSNLIYIYHKYELLRVP